MVAARIRGTLSSVTAEQELMVIFGGLHLIALSFAAILFVMFLRSETMTAWEAPRDEDDGGGGGGNDRVDDAPRHPSPGGFALDNPQPARARLRGHERLADAYPERRRRPAHDPAPRRTPARKG